MTVEQAVELLSKLIPDTYESLILPAAPIQDAINLARFMVGDDHGVYSVFDHADKDCRWSD